MHDYRFETADDITERISFIVKAGRLSNISLERIFCIRSFGAKTRAYARIWGLARVWQKTLGIKPAYIIEVVSERFDKLPAVAKDKILLHELAHIPKGFSGALVPHKNRGGVNSRVVESLYDRIKIKNKKWE